MIANPLLSVVVSAYKQERYIAQCLDAIIADLDGIDAEIIIACDLSPDSTYDIANNYVRNFPNLVRLLEIPISNLGANKNYIRAHASAVGDYVAHLDGDDVAVKGKFSTQLAAMRSIPNAVLCMHAARYFNDDESVIKFTRRGSTVNEISVFSKDDMALWGVIAVHSSYMYLRSSVDLTKITLPFMEWKVAMAALNGGAGLYINSVLVDYRSNGVSSAMTGSNGGRANAYKVHEKDVCQIYEMDGADKNNLYAQAVFNFIVALSRNMVNDFEGIKWILKNFYRFRPFLILKVWQMRKMMRPSA